MSNIQGAIRTFAALGAGELIGRLVGFASTIYIARTLGAEMYGVVGFGFALLLYTTIFADAGLEYIGPREVVTGEEQLAALVRSLLASRVAVSLLTAGVQVAVAAFLPSPERAVVSLYALALLPVGLNLRWAAIGLGRAGGVAVSRLVGEGLKFVIIVATVRGPGDVLMVPVAQAVGDLLAAVTLLWQLRGSGALARGPLRFDLALPALRRGLPLLGNAVLAMMIYNADIIMVRIFREAADVGRYLAAYTILNFVGILGHVAALSLTPSFTKLRAHAEQGSELLQSALLASMVIGLPMAVGGTITAHQITSMVFGPAYDASAIPLAILIWCFPPLMYRSVLQAAMLGQGLSRAVLTTTATAAVTNMGLNLVAIPVVGIVGAALTSVVAEGVRALLAGQHVRQAGYAFPAPRRYARTVGAVLMMAAVLLVTRLESFWLAVPVGALTYGITLALIGGLRVRRYRIEFTL